MKLFKTSESPASGFFSLMKNFKILALVILVFLASCESSTLTDDRPASQKSFINKIKVDRDQATNVSLSDPNRPVMIDDSVKRIKLYIIDTLKSKFSGWDARVLDNSKTDPNGTEIRITFGMSIDGFNLEETARYKSVVFREWLSDAQSPLKEKLESLQVGDHVEITGSFVSRDKRIDIDPYNEKEFKVSKNIFSNPEFRVDITDIRVVED